MYQNEELLPQELYFPMIVRALIHTAVPQSALLECVSCPDYGVCLSFVNSFVYLGLCTMSNIHSKL